VTFGETSGVFVARDIGRMRYCRDFQLRPGGAEATVAVGVQRLGFASGWISALGDDEVGHYLRGLIAGEGVDVSNVVTVSGRQTAVFLRERLPGGRARHFYYRQGSAFSGYTPEMLDERYIGAAKVAHVTGINPALSESCDAASWRFIEIAKTHGVLTTFDPNVRLSLWRREDARRSLERYLAAADVVLPGLEDMQMLYGRMDAEEALERLLKMGCTRVVLKTGEGEVIVCDRRERTVLPVEKIESPIDLMGAGDAFAAGCIAGLLRGFDLARAAQLGITVASLAIQMPGNIEAMPTWNEVQRAVEGKEAWTR